MSAPELYRRLLFIIATSLLVVSLGTLGLTSHAKWLLGRYFPVGSWYIWRGQNDVYDEQQTRQQWISVEYSETTERLAIMRAVLGVVAGVLGIWALRVKRRSVVEQGSQDPPSCYRSKTSPIRAMVCAIVSFTGTLTSAIWSAILYHQSSKHCSVPAVLNEYNTKYTCTREIAACAMLPVITKLDDDAREQTCVETKTVRWLLVPMLVLGLGSATGHAVQVWSIMRREAVQKSAEGRVAALEKAD